MSTVILVVDDDVDIRETIVDVLIDNGYDGVGAANGAEALEVLRTSESPPCLIFLDLMMPVMDAHGFRSEQLGNPDWAKIPVVLMSAYRDVADQATELAVDFLPKPIGVATLIETTRRHCRGRHSSPSL